MVEFLLVTGGSFSVVVLRAVIRWHVSVVKLPMKLARNQEVANFTDFISPAVWPCCPYLRVFLVNYIDSLLSFLCCFQLHGPTWATNGTVNAFM